MGDIRNEAGLKTAHKPRIAGSNPAPATTEKLPRSRRSRGLPRSGTRRAATQDSRGADDAPGALDGVGLRQAPVADDWAAVDERPLNAARPRDIARPAVRHVVDDLLLVAGDGARVEDRDVRREPGGEAPAVGDAEDLRRGSRDEAHRGLERQGLALAHPVAEELARLARLRKLGDVGAR